jgi:hypothetical protein
LLVQARRLATHLFRLLSSSTVLPFLHHLRITGSTQGE